MPHRFPLNSTNQLVQLAKETDDPIVQIIYKTNQQLQDLLQQFNMGVEGSFTAGGMQGMEPLTTPDGYEIMKQKYATWKSRDVTELNLVSCEFLAFDLSSDHMHAEAYTFEKWVFVYADGKQVPTKGSVDRYKFSFVDGKWLVESAKTYAEAAD